jgi:hypothetical protein
MELKWSDTKKLSPKSCVCGFCGTKISSNEGFSGIGRSPKPSDFFPVYIYICSGCNQPIFFDVFGRQHPSSNYGEFIENIPQNEIALLYDEARNCYGCGAYTASVMCCRKLLMHIAVDKGAPENKKFFEYVDFLISNHYIHADSKEWVDLIRQIGNDANHEIKIMAETDAILLIDFISMILKILFDYPARAKKHSAKQ